MQSKSSRKLSVESQKISSFLLEYQPQIDEIRRIILRSIISFTLGATIALIFNRQIFLFLLSFFDLKKVNIVSTSPYQFINISITLAIFIGVLTTVPVFLYHFLIFIRPALKDSEFKLIKKLIPLSLILFVFGCLFGAMIEQFIVTLYSQGARDYALSNFWDIESFLSQLVVMSICMGFIFQLPIVLTILIKLKILTLKLLSSQRRYIYAGLLIFTILMPPTDLVSNAFIFFPLVVLFEGTLLFNRNSR